MKTVRHTSCPCGVKRAFMTEREAEKALGRAKAKRSRTAASQGTARGIRIEHRWYECDFGGFHLTGENRRDYQARAGVRAA